MRNKYRGADIRARLGGTIIRYKGEARYCEVEGETVCLHDIVNKNLVARVTPDDPLLDISSLTLGYYNIRDKAVYAMRNPYRRYKQGVDFYSLTYLVPSGTPLTRFEADHMWCQGFVDGFNGIYPNLRDALTMIRKKTWTSVAISQDVAIANDGKNLKIYIKGEEEGWLRVEGETITGIIPKSDTSWILRMLLEYASRQWTVSEGVPNV